MKQILIAVLFSFLAIQSQAQSISITSSLTDTDVEMIIFLEYVDRNDNCRSIDITVPISIPASATYTDVDITANGWWQSGGAPNMNPSDMKIGTQPFFSGVQIMHECEAASYTPTNCTSNVNSFRVWDHAYTNNCTPNSNTPDCMEYSSGCSGPPASCFTGQTINATFNGGVNATVTITH